MKSGSEQTNIAVKIAGLKQNVLRIFKGTSISPKAQRLPYGTRLPSAMHRTSHSNSINIRGRRVYFLVAVCSVFVIVCAVLIIMFTGANSGAAAAAPSTAQVFPATLVMPVYASISISEGVSAGVIEKVQQRLMDLGYMDQDATDGIYSDQTVQAVKHFQSQENIQSTDTIDQQTYDLLFSPTAPEYVISLGAQDSDNGTDVSSLQQQLYTLGYLSESGVTGTYDENTQAAVEKFQKLNNLEVTGIADKKTRELLYSDNAVTSYYAAGEEGDDILKYQQQLYTLGYLTSVPDGKFGADTKAAIQRFQQNNGLAVDGCLGPQTEQALMSPDAEINALSLGAKGNDVSDIQTRLKVLKYLSSVTGYFGSATDTAVRSFQHNNGLPADGKVGPTTMKVLMSDSAKKSTGVTITGANVSSFISVAKSKLGCKYVGGGKGPSVFDCSGFVYWCLNKVGVKQVYMTSAGWANCSKYTKITSMSSLKRGDVIVYQGHVAICLGSGYQIEAASSKGKVIQRQYTGSSYWKSVFVCGFRIF